MGPREAILSRLGTRHVATWFYGPQARAASATFGTGCAGTAGAPLLTAGTPFLGNDALVLDLMRARELAPTVIALAGAIRARQFGGGCTLYLQEPVIPSVLLTSATGFATLRLAVPLDPGLVGTVLHAQGFVLDPLGAFAGLSFTPYVSLLLGL